MSTNNHLDPESVSYIPSDQDIKLIYTNIFLGRGKHGDFLRAFANAVMRADRSNFELLKVPALQLISKYNLQGYK